MKADRIRATVTVNQGAKIIALVISIIETATYPYGIEKILRTICGHFGYRIERRQE